MLKTWLSVAATLVTAGVLAATIPTTIQLAHIDSGLNSSVHSTGQLVQIEKTVIQENSHIQQLVSTANHMSGQLKTTAAVTHSIEQNIALINTLNAKTLELNQSIAKSGGLSAQNIHQIASNMSLLDQATAKLSTSLSALSGTVQQDTSDLANMRQATTQMNQKVPGVTG